MTRSTTCFFARFALTHHCRPRSLPAACGGRISLSDYFKAIHVVMGGQLTADENHIYVPLRMFDEDILVLPSGRSIIAPLLTMAN
jgi:hypothetical protein